MISTEIKKLLVENRTDVWEGGGPLWCFNALFFIKSKYDLRLLV